MRKFKINGYRFEIVNRPGADNVNEQRYKYDVKVFNEKKQYWARIASCNLLADGKVMARDYVEGLMECINYEN